MIEITGFNRMNRTDIHPALKSVDRLMTVKRDERVKCLLCERDLVCIDANAECTWFQGEPVVTLTMKVEPCPDCSPHAYAETA